MANAPLPDAVRIVVNHLIAANLALVLTRVYGFDLPSSPTFPAVRVLRIGGANVVNERFDGARLQIDVFGGTAEQSHDAMAAVRAELWDLEGTVGATGVVAGIQELSGACVVAGPDNGKSAVDVGHPPVRTPINT